MKKLNIVFIISMLLIMCLPSFIFVMFKVSSLATGIVLASAMLIAVNIQYLKKFKIMRLKVIMIIFIFLILFVQTSYFYIELSISKPFYSLLSFILVIIAAFLFAQKNHAIPYEGLINSILVIILILITLGWMSFFYIPFSAYTVWVKAVFPFSEESHFALALGILTVSYASVGNLNKVIFININLFLLSLLYPSLTLLVFSLLCIFTSLLRFKPIYFKLILLLFPLFIILILSGVLSDIEYFSSRLNFDDSRNLTTLVFLQGWDMAYINLVSTKGLGIGFQMLGMSDSTVSKFTEIIREFGAKDYNLFDGGLLAAKVIAEFGIVGIIFILSYIYFIYKYVFYTNSLWHKINKNKDLTYQNRLKKRLLFLGFIFGFLVEVFLRGYGYFSPGVFLILVAIFYLGSNPEEKFNLK